MLRGDEVCGVAVKCCFNFRVLCGAMLRRSLLLGLSCFLA